VPPEKLQTVHRISEKPSNSKLLKYGKERRAALDRVATAKARLYSN
jgi:hypothetical protein